MKKLISLILALVLCLTPVLCMAMPGVTVGGEAKSFAPDPYKYNWRIYAPTRGLLQDLGFTVTYEEETKTIIAANPETNDYMGLQIDNTTYTYNGKTYEFDVAPQKIGDLTFLPVRIVYEMLGYEVTYDEATDTAIIK